MRLAIIPTAYRTIFFHALAKRLEVLGHEVFWLSPNQRWARWLLREGVAASRVLQVSGEVPRRAPIFGIERLQELERAGTLTMRNIITMDPLLQRRDTEYALAYLAHCESLVRQFIVSNGIQVVFGEQTWAIELLIGQICRRLRVPHLVPETVRIPDPRFAFFDGHLQTDIVGIRPCGGEERRQAERILEDYRNRQPRPTYASINFSVLRPQWSRLWSLLQHVIDLAGDRYDETSRRPGGLVVDHSRQVLRGAMNRCSRRFISPTVLSDRPFVLFLLHKQPEASIDIIGSPFCNQLEIARAMARTLPLSHDLYIKEHPTALPTRPARFYRALNRIPGVVLIHPFADSFPLITQADLVVTIAGTASYEAAVLGRPAVTIAPIFFDQVVMVPRFDPHRDSLARLLVSDARPVPKPPAQLVEFLAWLLAQSFPGIVGDAFWRPDSMTEQNLDEVARGFGLVLEVLEVRLASRR